MNNKAQVALVYVFVIFLVFLVTFALISVFKDNMDKGRGYSNSGTGTSGLNCPGTPTFNQTDYDEDTASQKLIRRPTCFVTGLSLVWFVGAILVTGIMWVYKRWVAR